MDSGRQEAAEGAQRVLVGSSASSHVLVVSVLPGEEERLRLLCGELPGLVRAVGSRDPESDLSCVVGFANDAWHRVSDLPGPSGLHAFAPVYGVTQTAPASPGDVFFHVRSMRRDLCFELALAVTARLGRTVRVDLEVQGFRYFDNRSLLGFVDDVECPAGPAAANAAIIGAEDPQHAGGSFILVQSYLHDLEAWNELHVCEQERVVGRSKVSNLPILGARRSTAPADAHDRQVHHGPRVVRADCVFGAPGQREFGSLVVAYSASVDVLVEGLRRLFVGVPVGNYHPILDFSTALSGGLFYAPPTRLLRSLSAVAAPSDEAPAGPSRLRSVSTL